jgi:hypothetical protein
LSAAEQILVRELKTIDVQVRNADSFFRDAEWHAEVDQIALYELMEMDGNEKTRLVEEAYARFYAVNG